MFCATKFSEALLVHWQVTTIIVSYAMYYHIHIYILSLIISHAIVTIVTLAQPSSQASTSPNLATVAAGSTSAGDLQV
jgi:hypothetical protein